jgi:hypothetical protein
LEFYKSLGLRQLRELSDNDILIELEMRGGTHLVFVFDPNSHPNGRQAPFDLMCEDLHALHDEMSARGIEVTDVTGVPYDHSHFTFRDPDGYIVRVNDTHVEGIV